MLDFVYSHIGDIFLVGGYIFAFYVMWRCYGSH